MTPDATQNASDPLSASTTNPGANGSANVPQPPAQSSALTPGASGLPPAQASQGGLKSILRIVVPLVTLVAVVFGVTYITIYTPPPEDKEPPPGTPDSNVSGPPLVFFTSSREWDPPNLTAEKGAYRNLPLLAPSDARREADPTQPFTFTLQDRIFQGFYEPNLQVYRRTQFWFENRNPQPVTMQLQGVNCSACTGGRLASIPREVTRNLLQHTALTVLPTGPFNCFGVGLVEPAAGLTQLQWQEYLFKDHKDPKEVTYHVDAAVNADKWSPQWGILELMFGVGQKERTEPLRAFFATSVDGSTQARSNEFKIMYDLATPCTLSRANIDLGKLDLADVSRAPKPLDYEFLIYSATRGPGSEFGDLETPTCQVDAPGGGVDSVKFVEVTKVERLPESELTDTRIFLKKWVRSAYKIHVVVRPQVGAAKMDIGLFERIISVTAGSVTLQMPVRAMVSGPVWLDNDRTDIDVGSFRGGAGLKQYPVRLTTEKAGVELALVPDDCKPAGFIYELEKKPDSGGEGHYELKITIPPGKVFGRVKGEVILEIKGPNPQRMRIPVGGSGRF